MANPMFSATTTGEKRLQEYITHLRKVAAPGSPIWDDIADVLYDGTMERFDREIDPDGKPWQKSWRAKVQNGKTLQNTGRLRDSINKVVDGTRISLKTNVKYAGTMQNGAVITPKQGGYLTFKTPTGGWVRLRSVKIPARRFLGLSKDDAQAIILTIEGYLLDAKP